jgi:hypothetical protein
MCKSKWMKSSVAPRCLAAARRVNEKGGRGIYLVDNKHGGIDFGDLMYTVPNSNCCRGFLSYFLIPAYRKLWGLLIKGLENTINFLP